MRWLQVAQIMQGWKHVSKSLIVTLAGNRNCVEVLFPKLPSWDSQVSQVRLHHHKGNRPSPLRAGDAAFGRLEDEIEFANDVP